MVSSHSSIPAESLPSSSTLYVPIKRVGNTSSLGDLNSLVFDQRAVEWPPPSSGAPGEWLSTIRRWDGFNIYLMTIEGLLFHQHELSSSYWLFEAEPSHASIKPAPIMGSLDRYSGCHATDARLKRHVPQWSTAADLEFSAACLEHAMQCADSGDFPAGIRDAALFLIQAARQTSSAYRSLPHTGPFVDPMHELRRVLDLESRGLTTLPDETSVESACKLPADAAPSALGFAQPFTEAIAKNPVHYPRSGHVAARCREAVLWILGEPSTAASSSDPSEKAYLEGQLTGVFLRELDWQSSILRSLLGV